MDVEVPLNGSRQARQTHDGISWGHGNGKRHDKFDDPHTNTAGLWGEIRAWLHRVVHERRDTAGRATRHGSGSGKARRRKRKLAGLTVSLSGGCTVLWLCIGPSLSASLGIRQGAGGRALRPRQRIQAPRARLSNAGRARETQDAMQAAALPVEERVSAGGTSRFFVGQSPRRLNTCIVSGLLHQTTTPLAGDSLGRFGKTKHKKNIGNVFSARAVATARQRQLKSNVFLGEGPRASRR